MQWDSLGLYIDLNMNILVRFPLFTFKLCLRYPEQEEVLQTSMYSAGQIADRSRSPCESCQIEYTWPKMSDLIKSF
jgi:hypothetical protein